MTCKPTRCPNCYSPKIKSGKFMGHGIKEATMRVGHLGHFMHNPVITLGAGAAWLIGKAIDAANHEWKCENCGLGFSSA